MADLFREDITPAQIEHVRQWVAALRSGEFEQGTGRLSTRDGKYCCLGVAAKIAGCHCVPGDSFAFPVKEEPPVRLNSVLLNEFATDHYGLSSGQAMFSDGGLPEMNDSVVPFSEIAILIEHELELVAGAPA